MLRERGRPLTTQPVSATSHARPPHRQRRQGVARAGNFALSREFYLALACKFHFKTPGLAELEFTSARFDLRCFCAKDWCKHSMF